MLYTVLSRMIERGQTDGLIEKIDVFYALGKISDNEYSMLISALK